MAIEMPVHCFFGFFGFLDLLGFLFLVPFPLFLAPFWFPLVSVLPSFEDSRSWISITTPMIIEAAPANHFAVICSFSIK